MPSGLGFLSNIPEGGITDAQSKLDEAQRQSTIDAQNKARGVGAPMPWEGPGFGEMFIGAEKQGLLPKVGAAVQDFYTKPMPVPQPEWENPARTDDRVPHLYKYGLYSARTPQEYEERLANMQDEIKFASDLERANPLGKMGAFVGTVATPEMLLAGSAETMAFGNTLLNMSRLRAAAKSAAVMGISAGTLEGANVATSETKPWEDVFSSMLLGGAIGGGLGVSKWGQRLLSTGGKPSPDMGVSEDTVRIAREEAESFSRSSGYLPPIFSDEFKAAADAESLARRHSPITLWDRLTNVSMGDHVAYNSKSGTAAEAMRRLAEVSNHDVTVARPHTAAAERERNFRALGHVFEDYEDHYNGWASDRGLSMKDHRFSGEGHEIFGREVMEELEHIKRTGQPLSTDPNIRKMVDELNPKFNSTELAMLKDAGVEGAAGVPDDPLHWHRRWQFEHMVQDPEGFHELLTKAIRGGYPEIMEKEARQIAKKVYSRMEQKFSEQIDPAIARYSEAHLDALEQAVRESIPNVDEGTDLLSKLVGNTPDKAPGYLRSKLNLDFSVEHNGKTLYDYIDTNMGQALTDRITQSAGRSALAKQGITSDAAWDSLRRDVMQDILKHPQAKDSIMKDLRKLDVVRRQLLGQATYDKPNSTSNKFLRDLLDLTHLGSMGNMGVAQATELGTLAAENGLINTIQAIPQMRAAKALLKKDKELAKDFACLSWGAGRDHKMSLPRMRTDAGRLATSEDGAILTGFRNGLQEGKRLMNYMSLQNGVMSAERNLWLHSTYIRFFDDAMVPGGTIPVKRLNDMGLGAELMTRIRANVQKHGKEFTEEGVKSLGLHKWPKADLNDFQIAMARQMNQAIQGNLAGESPLWATTAMGRVFAQFRNFPLVAWTKQAKRGLLLHDPQAFQTLAYGTLMSTLIHYARTNLDHAGNTSESAKKSYEAAMSPAGVAAGAMRYLPQATILPDIAAVVGGITGYNMDGRYRNGAKVEDALRIGGLAAGGGYITNAAKGVRGVVNGVKGEFGPQDAKAAFALVPFNNILGVKQIANHLIDAYKN